MEPGMDENREATKQESEPGPESVVVAWGKYQGARVCDLDGEGLITSKWFARPDSDQRRAVYAEIFRRTSRRTGKRQQERDAEFY